MHVSCLFDEKWRLKSTAGCGYIVHKVTRLHIYFRIPPWSIGIICSKKGRLCELRRRPRLVDVAVQWGVVLHAGITLPTFILHRRDGVSLRTAFERKWNGLDWIELDWSVCNNGVLCYLHHILSILYILL